MPPAAQGGVPRATSGTRGRATRDHHGRWEEEGAHTWRMDDFDLAPPLPYLPWPPPISPTPPLPFFSAAAIAALEALAAEAAVVNQPQLTVSVLRARGLPRDFKKVYAVVEVGNLANAATGTGGTESVSEYT